MNKVDLVVKENLMRFPTLFKNRFDVLAHMLCCCGTGYEWDKNGCLAYCLNDPDKEPANTETMLVDFENKVKETKEKLKTDPDCLDLFNRAYLAEDEFDLIRAKHVAKNIDIYACTFAGVGNDVGYWLQRQHYMRFGFNLDSVPINNKPENIDEDWRKAIYLFMKEIIPQTHSCFGYFDNKEKKWGPKKGYEDIFNWVYNTYHLYQSEKESSLAAEFSKIIKDILDNHE